MGTAHADPAPVPTPDISQQLVGTAAQAPQMLQNVAGALGGQPATPPPLASASIKMPQQACQPHGPRGFVAASGLGVAGSGRDVPTPGLGIPGLTTPAPAATTAGIPGLTRRSGRDVDTGSLTPTVPAAAAPATGPAAMLPQAQLNLPQIPGLPFPLPQQVSLPGDLTSLLGGGSPLTSGLASAAGIPAAAAPAATLPAVAAPVAPVATPNPSLFPVSALP